MDTMRKNISMENFSFEDLERIKKPYPVRSIAENGYVDMTLYPFLPGIFVALNDVHTDEIPMNGYLNGKDVILMNYCISGRCEFKVSRDAYLYVKDNLTSIGTLVISDSFHYPSGYYLGFEVYIYKKLFTKETEEMLKCFNIDVEKIREKYNNKDCLSILKTDICIQKLWMELYNGDPDIGMIRLNVLKILHYFSNSSDMVQAHTSYLTREQARIAKSVHDILTEDLSTRIPMREISGQLNVSESSLKNYFSAMYGMPVSEYMKKERLKKAASLLSETRLSISDVAYSCGFSNQGRFAKIFKEEYGAFPLEYRRSPVV